jgi:methyl-accepting chemotaxis protein
MEQHSRRLSVATLEERVAELAAIVKSWEPWREEATRRFTDVEEKVEEGSKRLGQIQSNVEPVLERLAEFNRALAQLREGVTAAATQLAEVAADLAKLDTRVNTIARVARPGRSVVREAVATLEAQVAELRAAAEPALEEETRATD